MNSLWCSVWPVTLCRLRRWAGGVQLTDWLSPSWCRDWHYVDTEPGGWPDCQTWPDLAITTTATTLIQILVTTMWILELHESLASEIISPSCDDCVYPCVSISLHEGWRVVRLQQDNSIWYLTLLTLLLLYSLSVSVKFNTNSNITSYNLFYFYMSRIIFHLYFRLSPNNLFGIKAGVLIDSSH